MLRLTVAAGRIASASLVVGAGLIGACRTVKRIEPAQYLEENSPQLVWVTYTNNTVVQVLDPEIRRDTLRGLLQGARVRIPMVEIQSVQARVLDPTKTAILLGAMGVAAVSSMYFMFISKSGPDGITIDCANDAVEEHPEEHPECQN
jgi:hypothetical protein